MRQLCFIIISAFIYTDCYAQNLAGNVIRQSYYLENMPNAPGVYMQTAYKISGISTTEKTKTIQMIDATVEAVKKVYPQPVGAHVGIYSGIFENYRGNSEFKNCPYTVYITIPFYELYKTSSGGIEASGEYMSSIQVWINSIKYLLQANSIHYGNDRVFRSPVPGIAVNGFPKYNNMILVVPEGKSLPWRPATKQEYLENFIEGLKISLPGRSVTSGERNLIPSAENLLASMSPTEKKQIAYLRKEKYGNNKNGYAGFESLGYGSNWAGFQDASDTTAEQLVIVDENFYDKNLPRTSYQVLVIERRFGSKLSSVHPTQEQLDEYNGRTNRLNSIVRSKELLPSLQQLLGKTSVQLPGTAKKSNEKEKYIFKRPVIKNIDAIVDRKMMTYKYNPPAAPSTAAVTTSAKDSVDLPKPNSKKLSLASRKLETKQDVINYVDELEQKLSGAFGGTSVKYSDDAGTNDQASYGYWLAGREKESLMLAVRAAKQKPDNDCVLNNLASTLSLCGADYLATPLYIVCLKKEQNNSTINNNLGQSWLQLGDPQQAELYLKKAIGANPFHPDANNSLGYIYKSQGRKGEAMKCFENSLRGAFTLRGFNGLGSLDHEKQLKLMDYIRNRYKQPDYINFDKYPAPLQCVKWEETEIRKAEHKAYQKAVDDEYVKYTKLYNQQKPVAENSMQKYYAEMRKKVRLKPFQYFAYNLLFSIQKEFEDKLKLLDKDLRDLERQKLKLQIEYDTSMVMIDSAFAERLRNEGEGNVDLTVDQEICDAKTTVVNYYLPLFADINEERFRKIVHTYKDYLNDYLYWVRFASPTEESYRLSYYHVVQMMLQILSEVRLTTLEAFCDHTEKESATNQAPEIKYPKCPLPVAIEIPFVIGKVTIDCDSWGLEGGEGVVINIDHKMGGETTIAFGAGLSEYLTPEIGKKSFNLKPGIDAGAKGQFFITFEGSEVMDGGFLWEAEIDVKGIGKPAELKQNFTWAINKGFSSEGALTTVLDKIYEIPPDQQINKNIKIYKSPN